MTTIMQSQQPINRCPSNQMMKTNLHNSEFTTTPLESRVFQNFRLISFGHLASLWWSSMSLWLPKSLQQSHLAPPKRLSRLVDSTSSTNNYKIHPTRHTDRIEENTRTRNEQTIFAKNQCWIPFCFGRCTNNIGISSTMPVTTRMVSVSHVLGLGMPINLHFPLSTLGVGISHHNPL